MDPALLFMVVIYCPCVEDMVHVANVLYLISYLVRDILWLRVLTIFAGLSLLPFYCHCSDHILWAPIGWNALFISVNLIQIGILLRERRPRRWLRNWSRRRARRWLRNRSRRRARRRLP